MDEDLVVRIEERLKALDERNAQAHEEIMTLVKEVKRRVDRTNGSVAFALEKIAVLDDRSESQKWLNRTLFALVAGSLIAWLTNTI